MSTISQEPLPGGAGPKYQRVMGLLRNQIRSGALEIGAKLPPVRDLAYRLGITPGTVARAYKELTEEGLLQGAVGRGTFVAAPPLPIEDDVWSHPLVVEDDRSLSLITPCLPELGQDALMRRAFSRANRAGAYDFASYPTRHSSEALRRAIVDWLEPRPLGPLSVEDVQPTYGGQHAICSIMQASLVGARPAVLVEELSYGGFRRAAELVRADVIGVEMDEQGMLPDALDAAARNGAAQLVCLTPEVQNPSCGFASLERRQQILAVAERRNLTIIEDDCYRTGPSRAPGYRMLAPDRCWYVSTLSKSLSPALRFGWAVAPLGRGKDLRRVLEYGAFGMSAVLSATAQEILSDPETRPLCDALNQSMTRYVEVAVNVLGGFDLAWQSDVPFLWLRLPAGWRASSFCRAAEADGIQLRSADEFALRDGRAPSAVRISVNARASTRRFEAAMLKLRALLDNPAEMISV